MIITKTFRVDDIEVKPGSKEVVAIASTDTVDVVGDVVLPSGLEKTNYSGSPILWAHDHGQPQIGTLLWIKANPSDPRQVIAKYRLHCKTQLSQDVFTLLQMKELKQHSIGFEQLETRLPTPDDIKARPEWKEARQLITSWRLVELSVCNVGCNRDTLPLAVAKGVTADTLGMVNWPEDCVEWEEKQTPYIQMPKYSRKIISMQHEIMNKARRQISMDEVMARLHGKA